MPNDVEKSLSKAKRANGHVITRLQPPDMDALVGFRMADGKVHAMRFDLLALNNMISRLRAFAAKATLLVMGQDPDQKPVEALEAKNASVTLSPIGNSVMFNFEGSEMLYSVPVRLELARTLAHDLQKLVEGVAAENQGKSGTA